MTEEHKKRHAQQEHPASKEPHEEDMALQDDIFAGFANEVWLPDMYADEVIPPDDDLEL